MKRFKPQSHASLKNAFAFAVLNLLQEKYVMLLFDLSRQRSDGWKYRQQQTYARPGAQAHFPNSEW